MKRYIINNILAVCVAILLIVISLAFVVKRIDPNDYKERISNLVLKQTGKTIIFQGNLEMSIFPAIALHTGPITILDDDIFGANPFLTIDDAFFHLAFWPLLQGNLEVTEVSLESLKIKLATTSRGEKNWLKHSRAEADQYRQASGITRLEDDHPPRETSQKKWAFVPTSTFWNVKNCEILWLDLASKEEYTINISSGTLTGNILEKAALALQGSITDRYKIRALTFELAGTGALHPDAGIQGTIDTLKTKITSTATQKTLQLTSNCQFTLDWQNPSLILSKINGTLNSSPFNGSLVYLGKNNLILSADVHQAFKGDFFFSQIDLDTIAVCLASAQTNFSGEANSTDVYASMPITNSSASDESSNPLAFFKQTDLELTCTVDTLNFSKAQITSVIVNASATQGDINAKASANTFEGQAKGTIHTNARAKNPIFKYDLALHDIQLQYVTPLLQLLKQEPLVKGTLNGTFAGTAQGRANHDWLKKINAKGHLALTNAECKASPSFSFITQKVLPYNLNFTFIKEASVQFALKDGIISAQNFVWDSPQAYITGKGQYSIPKDYWDVTLLLSGSSELPSLPLHIIGSFPNVSVTLNAPKNPNDIAKQIKKSVLSTIQKEVTKKNRQK